MDRLHLFIHSFISWWAFSPFPVCDPPCQTLHVGVSPLPVEPGAWSGSVGGAGRGQALWAGRGGAGRGWIGGQAAQSFPPTARQFHYLRAGLLDNVTIALGKFNRPNI